MPYHDPNLAQQWQLLGQSLGHVGALWQREGERLIRNWNRWPRSYHNTHHLSACLGHLGQIQLQEPHALANHNAAALALWFHDAVYWPWSRRNEARSAAWAARFLQSLDVSPELVEQVHHHIMATQKHDSNTAGDTRWVLDIDLAILGSSPAHYHAFECNVRKEYAFIPVKRYIAGRLAILQSFAQRSTIYLTPYFAQRYEARAKHNIDTAISDLQVGRLPSLALHG